MFLGCNNFNQPFDKWNVSNVYLINSMFLGCENLTSITIPKKFENKVESIFCNLDLSKVEVTYI